MLPVLILACTVCGGFAVAQSLGVACAALGMLGTMSVTLGTAGYGPIVDNAGGIAQMAAGVPDKAAGASAPGGGLAR